MNDQCCAHYSYRKSNAVDKPTVRPKSRCSKKGSVVTKCSEANDISVIELEEILFQDMDGEEQAEQNASNQGTDATKGTIITVLSPCTCKTAVSRCT